MRRKQANQPHGVVRIIAGRWRGRKLEFPATSGLRPTGDRMRETVFNWLAPTVAGAHCLDAFAGSGALGIEALSREAASCVFLETEPSAAQSLRANLKKLDAPNAEVVQASALEWLSHTAQQFDLVFLDPPFDAGLYEPFLSQLLNNNLLRPGALLYVESDRSTQLTIPEGMQAFRDKTAGNTRFQLWEYVRA